MPGSGCTGPGPGRGRSDPRPLIPAHRRRLAAAFVLACALVVAVLGVLFAGQSRPDRLDAAVGSWLRSTIGTHPAPLHVLANFGEPPLVTALTVVLVLAAMVARRWRGAVLAAVAVPLAAALTELALKPLFGRTINGALSYPSGHATAGFALATVAAILFTAPARPGFPPSPGGCSCSARSCSPQPWPSPWWASGITTSPTSSAGPPSAPGRSFLPLSSSPSCPAPRSADRSAWAEHPGHLR